MNNEIASTNDNKTVESVAPRWHAHKNEQGYEVAIEVPGVPKDQLRVSTEKRVLVINAERPVSSGNRELLAGRPAAKAYSLRLNIPNDADPEKIEGNLNNGLLKVVLPLRAEILPRDIPLN